MHKHMRFPLALGAAALLSAPAVQAQSDEEEFDRTPRRCVTTTRIRSTDIVDDRTILFYLRGNREVYRTYMPRECPGLERNERFSYQTHSGQLCDTDTITVLEQIGTSLTPTFTCRLGEFHPITREEADELKLQDEGETLRRNAIRSEPAELPEGDAAEGGEGDAAQGDAAQGDAAQSDSVAEGSAEPDEPRRSRRSRRNAETTAR